MAGQQTLTLYVRVRLLPPQFLMVPSSRGLGHRPLTAVTGVRIPLGLFVLGWFYKKTG